MKWGYRYLIDNLAVKDGWYVWANDTSDVFVNLWHWLKLNDNFDGPLGKKVMFISKRNLLLLGLGVRFLTTLISDKWIGSDK